MDSWSGLDPTMPGTFYRFVYMRPYPGTMLMPHQIRDADAANELFTPLNSEGKVYGDIILNYPPSNGFPPEGANLPEMGPEDILVLTTRPPLNDADENGRKQVPRSYSDLEKAIFHTLHAAFTYSSRRQVELRKALTPWFLPDCQDWSDTCFSMYAHGTTGQWFAHCTGRKAHGSRRWIKPAAPRSTAAYLCVTPPIWPDGPRALCVFGMTATETLAWCRLLRRSWWSTLGLTLDTPRVVMAELVPGALPVRPDTLAFMDDWGVRILLDAPYPRVEWKEFLEVNPNPVLPQGKGNSQRMQRT